MLGQWLSVCLAGWLAGELEGWLTGRMSPKCLPNFHRNEPAATLTKLYSNSL